jgi:hypothetical protein
VSASLFEGACAPLNSKGFLGPLVAVVGALKSNDTDLEKIGVVEFIDV